MKILLVAFAAVLVAAGVACAAQGEFEVITGKIIQSGPNSLVVQARTGPIRRTRPV